jgi:hypothetical protein
MVKEISNSCVILRYLQLFEDNKKFIEIGERMIVKESH